MATFEKITTVTVGSGGASSIEFNPISGSWTDLCIKISARYNASATTGYCVAAFNGSTSSFSITGLYGGGSGSAGSFTTPSNFVGEIVGNSATASTFSNLEMYIPNYAGSTHKSYSVDSVGENNATTSQATFTSGRWANTAAITSITFTPNSGNFMEHTTATIYGIKKA